MSQPERGRKRRLASTGFLLMNLTSNLAKFGVMERELLANRLRRLAKNIANDSHLHLLMSKFSNA